MKRSKIEVDEFTESPEEVDITTAVPDISKDDEQDAIFLRGVNGGGDWVSPDKKKHKLYPFSYAHRLAIMGLGARLFKLSADEIEVLSETGYYDGITTDVVLFTWLCLRPGSDASKEARNPNMAFDRAMKWGEANRIEPGYPQFDAAATFMSVEFENLSKAKGNLKPADGRKAEKGKAPGKR